MTEENIIAFPAVTFSSELFPFEAPEARDWLIEGALLRKRYTVIVAPGGTGKSLLVTQLSMALASGTSWGNFMISQPYKVMLLNKEDDLNELRLRASAALQAMFLTPADIKGLRVVNQPSSAYLAIRDSGGRLTEGPFMKALRKDIVENGIDVLIVDPFVEMFIGNENDNSEMGQLVTIIRTIADELNIAVVIIHHTPKGAVGREAGNQDSARGAGAIGNGARVMFTLTNMDKDYAIKSLVPGQEHLYVQLSQSKSNYVLKTAGGIWFKKISVAVEVRGGIGYEWVGAFETWTPPNNVVVADDELTTKLKSVVLQIRMGVPGTDGKFRSYSRNHRNKLWAGKIFEEMEIKNVGGLIVNKEWIQAKLTEWEHKEVIKVCTAWNEAKNEYIGYEIQATQEKLI